MGARNSSFTIHNSHISPSVKRLATYPQLYSLAKQLSQLYNTHHVTQEALKKIGLALWQVLDIDVILPSKALIIEQRHSNAIAQLPWECLYHPKLGFLGKHPEYTLSRLVSSDKRISPPPLGPLSILQFTAQPENISRRRAHLAIEEERYWVRAALEPFISTGKVRFYAPNCGDFTTLIKLLHSQSWHVVLLSGHAVFNQDGSPAFVFESEGGHGEMVSDAELAQVFGATNVQCVVIAACQSGDSSATATSLAMQIAQAGVQYVVGMREQLIDRAASVFVQTMCVALAQQTRVDMAVQQSRRAMTQLLAPNEVWRGTQSNDPSVGQWCLPMLLSHFPTQPLVDWNFCLQPISLPPLVGSKIANPSVFIGHRPALRTLGEGLRSGAIRQLLIHGSGGLGKTALAGQLAMTLEGYRVLVYQASEKMAFIPTLAQALELPKVHCLETLLQKIVVKRWVLWLDNLECVQNRHNDALTDNSIKTALEILYQWKTADLRILLTSRRTIPQMTHLCNYHLTRPNFTDFSRYIQHLGLPYQFPQILKIYQVLGGHFQGVQLLQSMPLCLDTSGLTQQLAIVRRYLQAYSSMS